MEGDHASVLDKTKFVCDNIITSIKTCFYGEKKEENYMYILRIHALFYVFFCGIHVF